MEYRCGDIGSSGVGIVFYASATPFKCGQDMTSSCNYLESAPNLWDPKSQSSCDAGSGGGCGGSDQDTSDLSGTGKGITWCTGKDWKSSIPGAVNSDIGSGFSNTLAIVPMCNAWDAASAAQQYMGGRKMDWALPSQDELNALVSYTNRNAIGGFVEEDEYWSSSQYGKKYGYMQVMRLTNLYQAEANKSHAKAVRPIRAF
jgi:hypothetical protein